MIQKLLSGLLALALLAAAGLLVFLPTTPLVAVTASEEELNVSVQPRPLVLSCPGPAVRIGGASGVDASAVELIDRSELSFFGPEIIRTSETDWRILENSGIAQTTTSFSGYQYQIIDAERIGGQTLSHCQNGTPESWLLAGSTLPGNESLLVITNPDSVSALISVEFYGAEGYLTAEAFSIAPKALERINLARYAPGEAAVGVKVSSQGARVTAFSQHKSNTGLSATGVSITAAWQPAAESDILSVLVGDEEFAPQDRVPRLYLLNPTADPISATVAANSATGGFGSVYRVNLVPGVNSVDLVDLEPGVYSLSISAESEVLASVLIRNSLLGDFSWQTQTETFETESVFSSAVAGFVSVRANTESVILVRKEDDTGFLKSANRLSLNAGESAVVAISAGDVIRIDGADYKASVGSFDGSVGMPLFENENPGKEFSFRVY